MRTIPSLLAFALLAGIPVLACDPKPSEPPPAAPTAPTASAPPPPAPTAPPADAPAMKCHRDAKLCPDGTAVGRQGPNCEFPPCPTEKK